MQRLALSSVVAVLCACAPPAPLAKVWTPREFYARREVTTPIFGGWAPSELLVTEGQAIPYAGRVQATGEGLTVFPGVSEGRALGFVITDIWQDHPEPWLQPVWIGTSPGAPTTRRPGVPNVFPVGLDSTFYSPWWRARFVPLEDGETKSLRGAKDVLDRPAPGTGPVVFCPFTGRNSLGVAADGSGPRHPLTGRRLVGGAQAIGLVEGVEQPYLDFGVDRAPAEGQRLVESDLFVFTLGGQPLPIAAVWPADARAHDFLQRVEVPVPAGAAVFVPGSLEALRAPLAGKSTVLRDGGVAPLAPVPPAALDGFTDYALRLARDPSCFTAGPDGGVGGFPGTCEWLDSAERVQALPGAVRRNVQLSAATLDEVSP